MRTLIDNKLLLDADCPMCRLYAKGFEKAGWVDEATYCPYQSFDGLANENLDLDRARNEIALIDTQSNTVKYGIDAFRHIITNRFPFLNGFLKSRPVDFCLRKLYRFISFNRKVIAPSEKKEYTRECVPDINVRYRLAYMVFVIVCSSVVLYNFTRPINSFMGWQNYLGRELLICAGQILWQVAFLWKLLNKKLLEYLGNMMTVSMIGTLLLLPMLLFTGLPVAFRLFYFVFVVGFMLWEHLRRCKILKIGYLPTISWLVYRLVALAIIVMMS